jgi:hypothetical protein
MRQRLWLVALKKSAVQAPFDWPATVPAVPASKILDSLDCHESPQYPTSKRALEKLKRGFEEIQSKGGDLRDTWFVDYHASPRFGPNVQYERMGCLTKTRAGSGGPFVTSRMRQITYAETHPVQLLRY